MAELLTHFTVQEIAKAWKLDETTVRKLFVNEPGVLRIGSAAPGTGKRKYVTLRIPSDVLERVCMRRAEAATRVA